MAVYRPKYRDPLTGELKPTAVYWYEFVRDGKRHRASTGVENKREAMNIEAAEKTNLARGMVGIAEREPAPTLKEFSTVFMKQIEIDCASKPATISFYRIKTNRLLEHATLAQARLSDIDESMIESYKRTRRGTISKHGKALSPASVNRELATLRRALRMAHEWKKIDRVPRIRLLRGEVTREFVLARDAESAYIEALPEGMRDFATFLIDTGLRVGEALRLDWSAVSFRESPGSLRVKPLDSKNHKPRTVPLTKRARTILDRLKAKSGLVFRSAEGGRLYHTWLDQQHAAVRTALKLPAEFVLHSLRHTFGTRLGEAGADAFTIMKLMGHSSVVVSQKYVHPSTDAMKAAIARMDESVLPKESTKVERRSKRKSAVSS
jgi:integrase